MPAELPPLFREIHAGRAPAPFDPTLIVQFHTFADYRAAKAGLPHAPPALRRMQADGRNRPAAADGGLSARQRTNDPLAQLAHHESAHAVCANLLGVAIHEVSIVRDPDSDGRTFIEGKPAGVWLPDWWRLGAVIDAAGACGERLYDPGCTPRYDKIDRAQIRRVGLELVGWDNAPHFAAAADRQAGKLVNAHAGAVFALAVVLLEERRLDGPIATRIIDKYV